MLMGVVLRLMEGRFGGRGDCSVYIDEGGSSCTFGVHVVYSSQVRGDMLTLFDDRRSLHIANCVVHFENEFWASFLGPMAFDDV